MGIGEWGLGIGDWGLGLGNLNVWLTLDESLGIVDAVPVDEIVATGAATAPD